MPTPLEHGKVSNVSGMRCLTWLSSRRYTFVASFARKRAPCSSMRASLNHTVRFASYSMQVHNRFTEMNILTGILVAIVAAVHVQGLHAAKV